MHRITIAMVAVLSGSACLIYNLMVMQVEKSGHYNTLADSNRLRFVAVPPPRGVLYDRAGHPLAVNRTSYRLEVTPSLVGDLEETLQRLREIVVLDDGELRKFRRRFERQAPFSSVTLKANLSQRDLARFAVERHRFPGVEVTGALGRYYPYRDAFSHSIGYIGALDARDMGSISRKDYQGLRHIGKVGVERKYEELLRGKPGVRVVEADVQGRFIRDVSKRSPQPGQDILLTLDRKLQMVADEALGDREGAVVALDPRNGDILAMVSKPTFDPNEFVRGFGPGRYREMLNSPRRYFFNRATRGQYSPGSTIKPMVALAGLDHNITSGNYYIYAGPHYTVPGNTRRLHDWRPEGHGWVNLRSAIAQSCDVYFYDLSYRIGINRLHDVFVSFGFGSPSGSDGINEATGLVPSPRWKERELQMPWFKEETVMVGIGQGYFLATPLQLAAAVSMIANRGTRMQSRLIKAVRKHKGKSWEFVPARVADTVEFASEDWQLIVDAMVDAVHEPNGTAYNIGVDAPYIVAGKTGTVQTYRISEEERTKNIEVTEKSKKDHAMFIAFAPADNPVIAVAVVVEHVGGGSQYAAPIARKLLDAYLGQPAVVSSAGRSNAG